MVSPAARGISLLSKFVSNTSLILFLTGTLAVSMPLTGDASPEVEVVLEPERFMPDAQWRPWIERVISAVSSIGGDFPVPEVKVVLHASTGDQPVSLGWIRRNSPPEIHMSVSPDASMAELL